MCVHIQLHKFFCKFQSFCVTILQYIHLYLRAEDFDAHWLAI